MTGVNDVIKIKILRGFIFIMRPTEKPADVHNKPNASDSGEFPLLPYVKLKISITVTFFCKMSVAG